VVVISAEIHSIIAPKKIQWCSSRGKPLDSATLKRAVYYSQMEVDPNDALGNEDGELMPVTDRQNGSPGRSSSPAHKQDTESSLPHECSVCGAGEAEYTNDTCKCSHYCKKCAMKMATGGKCKECGELFTGMTSTVNNKK
jgi:hypothetical protein